MSKKIIAAIGVIGFLASTGVAFAEDQASTSTVTSTQSQGNGNQSQGSQNEDNKGKVDGGKSSSQQMVVQIGPKGTVLLRGTIVSVTSTSLSVKSWGGDWTVNVPSSAEVLPQGSALTGFMSGDFVGVQGSADGSASWTINATTVRDWTARQAVGREIKTNREAVKDIMSNVPRTVQGTASSIDANARTFTLTNGDGKAFSVSVTSGAQILKTNWATLDFTKISNGDTVRVYGPIASSTITASIVRDVSVK